MKGVGLNNICLQKYKKKFSIIVPCYNVVERIDKLIDMFTAKDYEDYEVIFIDDCSPDGSYEIFKKQLCNEDNLRIFQTNKNGGPGVARNVGLKNAIGEYIIFCDSDDEADITVLNNIASFLDEHNDADLLVFPYSIKRRGKISVCDEYSQYKQGDMVRVVDVAADFGTPFAKVYRKKLIDDKNLQFPARKSGEDKCFVVNYCTCIDKVYKIDSLYYTYVMNKVSLTHRKKHEQNITTTFELLHTIYQEYFPEIVERMYAETFLLAYAKHFWEIKEKNKRIKAFYKSENEKHPDWIKSIDLNQESLYRKLIFKAMAHSNGILIKLIMTVRGILY